MEGETLPRRAELLAAMSLAVDLGLGQPMEHLLRSCVLGTRLCDLYGLPRERRDRVFNIALVAWIGCHADSPEVGELFGDDISFRRDEYAVDSRGLPRARFLLGHVVAGETPLIRGVQAARFMVTGRRRVVDLLHSHWTSARALSGRLGLDEEPLDRSARLLATADSFQSWREPRPHRPALDDDHAAERLRREVNDGAVDGTVAEAVLAAAGQRRRRRTWGPAGLTAREIEVLRLLVLGRTNREVAQDLVISPKTARNHTEHIYTKLGVSNRVEATLFAVQHGIVPRRD